MDRPFTQHPEWMAFQKSLGRKVWRLDDGFIKATIIRQDVRMGQNWLYIPYGPELNMEMARDGLRNEVQHFARYLNDLARTEGSMFVKIEPTHDVVVELLRRNGLKLRYSSHTVQPHATSVVDLTRTVEQLTDALHHKHRYNIGLAERKGVTIEESDDVETFWKLLQHTAEHDDFRTHDRAYYQKLKTFFSHEHRALKVRLYLAHQGGRPVAGVLMLENGSTVHYLHGAMDREYRALMAPQLMHWQLIQRYKDRGFHWYDFWGIDANKWPGVTRFKLGFGGTTVEYPGAFDIVRKPFWRWLYKVAPR